MLAIRMTLRLTQYCFALLAIAIFALALIAFAAPAKADSIRVATYTASLSRRNAGDLLKDIQQQNPQVLAVAEVIQRVRPDVLLINEFDYDPKALALFQALLATGQDTTGNGAAMGISYAHSYSAPVNAGVPSGYDLNGNQEVGGPGDSYGFGYFPGQNGMAILSRLPIVQTRHFQNFLWRDVPDNNMPRDFLREDTQAAFRLSSKAHWDVTLSTHGKTLHLLASHPTPPVFDGPEDLNGRRNHDEIRFWADYIDGADYFYDDEGQASGLQHNERFVVLGNLNADPFDGDSFEGAILQLLNHPKILGSPTDTTLTPSSAGAEMAALRQSGANSDHKGDPAFDTADFGYNRDNPGTDRAPGNLRTDYILPSKTLQIKDAGVYWLTKDDPLFALAEYPTSTHRMVWMDILLPN